MKIVVTYESADIVRLIRQDLALQGITATDSDVKFVKNQAVVSVEVTRDDEIVVAAPTPAPVREPAPTPPPILEVVDGGNQPVDMSDILRASSKVAAANPGKFPVPERELMEGESFDFPGGNKR